MAQDSSQRGLPHVPLGPQLGRGQPEQDAPLAAAADQSRSHGVLAKAQALAGRHRASFVTFGVIGAGVYVAGLGVQVWLVQIWQLSPVVSYLAAGVGAIQASFLLNRRFTWSHRDVPFWTACYRFNAQKALTAVLNFLLYLVLVRAGVNYLAATLATTAAFTLVNYVLAHSWSFAARKRSADVAAHSPASLPAAAPAAALPTVSVVVPCKNNEDTIRATVESLLGQDYSALTEVILVGSTGDTTWRALHGIDDSRLSVLEQEPTAGRRDPNIKRDKGVRHSTGQLIALVDSDIVMPSNWLSRAVAIMCSAGVPCVAGGMKSIHNSFWGRYVDSTRLGAKTPRVAVPYLVTKESFARCSRKPPITANVLLTREMYDACPLDVRWSYGYEDYEWFWRVARAGYRVLFSDQLDGRHHHRRGLIPLGREYLRSAEGCARLVIAHPDCPLGRKRVLQATLIPIFVIAAAVLTGFAIAHGHPAFPLVGVTAVVACGAVWEFRKQRTLESFVHPFITAILGSLYIFGMFRGLTTAVVSAPNHPDLVGAQAVTLDRPRQPPWRTRLLARISRPLAAILAVQTAFSLSLVWSNTAFGDEADYLWIGHLDWSHWLHGTRLPGVIATTLSGSPLIYPPLGAMADSAAHLAGARILSMCFMLAATVLAYSAAARLYGKSAGLFAAGLLAVSIPVLRLTFATYDALSVSLTALAVWGAVQAARRRYRGEFVALAAISIALANATAYSSIVIDPALIGLAFLTWCANMPLRKAMYCTGWLVAGWLVSFSAVMTAGHSWLGLMNTVLERSTHVDRQSSSLILEISWRDAGLIIVLAGVGAALASTTASLRKDRPLVVLLACSSLLVTAGQMYEQTAWSLDKHLAYSALLGAIAGGYALSKALNATKPVRRGMFSAATAIVLFAYPAITGIQGAWTAYHLWPDSRPFISAFRPLAAKTTGDFYVSSSDPIPKYYTPQGKDWRRWNGCGISLNPPVQRQHYQQFYANRLHAGNCGLIVLFYNTALQSGVPGSLLLGPRASNDRKLLNFVAASSHPATPGLTALTLALEKDPGYRIASTGPFNGSYSRGLYIIWQKRGDAR